MSYAARPGFAVDRETGFRPAPWTGDLPRSRAEAESIAATRKRRLANNTYLNVHEDGRLAVRLHDTDIATFHPDGRLELDTGGWLTVTTKDRINRALPTWDYAAETGVHWTVHSEGGVWYLSSRRQVPTPNHCEDCEVAVGDPHAETCERAPGKVESFDRPYARPEELGTWIYADGVTIHPDGTVTGALEGVTPAELRALRRSARNFAKRYMGAFYRGEVPAPSGGDCWLCGMTTTGGKGLGEAQRDDSHVRSHIAESYYVPSLLARAVKRFPVSQFAESTLAAFWNADAEDRHREDARGEWMRGVCESQLRKSLQRYLYEQLGMAS